MVEAEVLDDDGRLHDRVVLVHEHRHALERPQRGELGVTPRTVEQAVLERVSFS
jgi:hypothetical protein